MPNVNIRDPSHDKNLPINVCNWVDKPKCIQINIFLVRKKDGGNRPVINLKKLNKFLPYHHLKMEGLQSLKYLLDQGDFLCKIDLKDAYFAIPLEKTSRKYKRFLWEGDLYKFTCLCFGLACAPQIFTKLLKVPFALLKRLNVRVVIYLDDMLIFGRSIEEAMQARDTLIFLLQKLGFVLNLEKLQLQPVKTLEFLELNMK